MKNSPEIVIAEGCRAGRGVEGIGGNGDHRTSKSELSAKDLKRQPGKTVGCRLGCAAEPCEHTPG